MLLVSVLGIGSVGYRLIEHWSWLDAFYMTVITVSTVGFTEVKPLSDLGRIHTIIVIILGVGTAAATISVVFEHFFQQHLKSILENRSMQREIDKFTQHTIVCGFGRMGRIIAASMQRSGHHVVVIEKDMTIAETAEKSGFHVVQGNAYDEESLSKAGINCAAALIATVGSDADNLFLTLTARGMNASLDIISRAEDENNTRKFTQAGASRVISPFAIGANHIVRLLTRPAIVDFVELVSKDDDVQFEVVKLEIDSKSPFTGKTLATARLRQEVGGMVLAIRKTDAKLLFDPAPESVIEQGDTLFVIASSSGRTPTRL